VLSRIFPERIDNHYRGHKFALWLLYPITIMKVAIALGAIFAADGGAQSADGIPLDTYGSEAAKAVIAVVAYSGLPDLFLGLLFVLALFRYRAMIPLMYVLTVADYLGHRAIGFIKPIVRTSVPSGSIINLTFFALSIAGLILSLRWKGPKVQSRPA
jgi:hypothetical protein